MAFGTQEAPAVSDGLRYGQDSVSKQWKKVQFKPLFQLRPSSALGKQALLILTVHWYRPENHGSRQIDRASRGRVAAEINIVRQTPHHRADFHKALSGSIFGFAFGLFGRKMDGLFEQAGSMCLKRTTTDGSLTGKLGLNFGSDFKSDGHVQPLYQFTPNSTRWHPLASRSFRTTSAI